MSFYKEKYNQLLKKIGEKNIKIEYLKGTDIPESFKPHRKSLFYGKITHIPTKTSIIQKGRTKVYLKYSLLTCIDIELKIRKKAKILNYVYLAIIYFLLLFFTEHFFRGDITRPSDNDGLLGLFLSVFFSVTLHFLFFFFMFEIKIFYRDIIIGLIGVFIIFGFAKKISIDYDHQYYENIRVEDEQRTNEEKIKFNATVEGLKAFIQHNVIDIAAIYKLGIKYPHQYPKTFDSITPDRSIVTKPFKGVPLKDGYLANAHFKLGELYQEKREFSESIYYYNKAIEIDSTVNEYHLRLDKANRQREYSEGYDYDNAIKTDSIVKDNHLRFDNI